MYFSSSGPPTYFNPGFSAAAAAAAAPAPASTSTLQIPSLLFSAEERRQSATFRGPAFSWQNRGVLIVDEKYPKMQHSSVAEGGTEEESLISQMQKALSLGVEQGQEEWLDCGNCWLANTAQGSEKWHQTRFGRVGMSKLGAALGLSTFENDTPRDLLYDVTGIKKKTFTEEQMIRMSYGTQFEPEARKWYERLNGVEAAEYGTFIPKFESHLNYSSDGLVRTPSGPRLIEIKCVKRMYGPLESYQSLKNRGLSPKIGNYMYPTQYSQCQGALLLTGYEFIDFIVFCPNEEKVFLETVTLDEAFWRQHFPTLYNFIHLELRPLLLKENLLGKMLFPPGMT